MVKCASGQMQDWYDAVVALIRLYEPVMARQLRAVGCDARKTLGLWIDQTSQCVVDKERF
jgi:hypothetical protein